jgi:glyoxylase-like metal-dependent hydrolase (beta-lactamase superfamily II)
MALARTDCLFVFATVLYEFQNVSVTTRTLPMLNIPTGVQVIERGWLSSNMVIAVGRHNTAVVDSGYFTHAEQSVDLVRSVLNNAPLNLLLNTHLHSDHCGGNFALQTAYEDLKTMIPPGHAPHVSHWDPVVLTHTPTGQFCPRFQYQGLLVPGTEVLLGDQPWQIHAALGHDPHSVILFEAETRTLISADALWENGFGVIFPELEGKSAFAEVDETLHLIQQLDPITVIPGHGRVFAYSDEVLQRARQRLRVFTENPTKHARHGAKVLLKFKLLEVQKQAYGEFKSWALTTSYFELVRSQFFDNMTLSDWIDQMIIELIRQGVAKRDGEAILNN